MQWRRGEAERFSIDSISQCTVIAANFDAGDTDDADEADDADDADDANDADEANDADDDDYADDADDADDGDSPLGSDITWKAGNPGGIWPVSVNRQCSLLSWGNPVIVFTSNFAYFWLVFFLSQQCQKVLQPYLLFVRRAVRVDGGSQKKTKYHWKKRKAKMYFSIQMTL